MSTIPTSYADSADAFWSALVWREHRGPWLGWGPLRNRTVGFPIRPMADSPRCPAGYEAGRILRGFGPHCNDRDCEFTTDYTNRVALREVAELVDLEATKAVLARRSAVTA